MFNNLPSSSSSPSPSSSSPPLPSLLGVDVCWRETPTGELTFNPTSTPFFDEDRHLQYKGMTNTPLTHFNDASCMQIEEKAAFFYQCFISLSCGIIKKCQSKYYAFEKEDIVHCFTIVW